jgi:hypothetical protein
METVAPGSSLTSPLTVMLALLIGGKLDGRDKFLTCGKFHRELSNEAMADRLKLTEGALRTALSRAQVRLLAGVKALAPEFFPA